MAKRKILSIIQTRESGVPSQQQHRGVELLLLFNLRGRNMWRDLLR